MKPVYYDLHIHSCLSPCGDNDMTPNNIVNMALLSGLDMIALTDHNSCKNCPALLEIARKNGLLAFPGMEITTAEEIHVICLFPALEGAMEFDQYVYKRLPDIENQPAIFGNQPILTARDEVVGEVSKLLTNATSIGIVELPALVRSFGGICFPAHIDRPSNSVLSVLGAIPPECGFKTVEIQHPGKFFSNGAHEEIEKQYQWLCNSDAHYLQDISERKRNLLLKPATFTGLSLWIG